MSNISERLENAWASQVHEKDGRFWFYTAVEHDPADSHGKSIGVAVADNPLGPFRDAKGSALVRNEDTQGPHHWDDIDPTVWTEEDGTSYLIWADYQWGQHSTPELTVGHFVTKCVRRLTQAG